MAQRISILTDSGTISMDLADLPASFLRNLGMNEDHIPLSDLSPHGSLVSPVWTVPAVSEADPFLTPKQLLQLRAEAITARNQDNAGANQTGSHGVSSDNPNDERPPQETSANHALKEAAEDVARLKRVGAAIKAGPLAVLALARLTEQVSTWHAKGWDVAADMLNHFLTGEGQQLDLSDADSAQVANDLNFQKAFLDDINATFPNAMAGGKNEVEHTFSTYFYLWDGQLFWAFGSLGIWYSGWVEEVLRDAGNGHLIRQLHYSLDFRIWKNYKFSPESHDRIDYLAPEFSEGWILQSHDVAHPFHLNGSFHITR
jgi:hypothetical protein